jgi:predicted lysophospholipase L1 biosynthesis ABC-type transport system permease subunit
MGIMDVGTVVGTVVVGPVVGCVVGTVVGTVVGAVSASNLINGRAMYFPAPRLTENDFDLYPGFSRVTFRVPAATLLMIPFVSPRSIPSIRILAPVGEEVITRVP